MTHWRKLFWCWARMARHRIKGRRRRAPRFLPGIDPSPDGRSALLIYMSEPFVDRRRDIRHQNRTHALTLERCLVKRGFRVDVADPGIQLSAAHPSYNLVVDLHPGLSRYSCLEGAKRIAYVTGSNPRFSNRAERQRLDDVYARRGVRLSPRRQVAEFKQADLAACEAMFFVGSRANLETFSGLSLPPVWHVSNFAFPAIKLANHVPSPRGFLFLASGGQVHKGLDLLLELFAKHPGWTLHVCSNFAEEPDFCRAYRDLLFHRPNIVPHGFQTLDSPAFASIATSSSTMLLPSCSEANAGAVLSGMACGLVPLVSRECGFSPEEVHYFPDCSMRGLEMGIRAFAEKPESFFLAESDRIRSIVETRYSLCVFETVVGAALDDLLAAKT